MVASYAVPVALEADILLSVFGIHCNLQSAYTVMQLLSQVAGLS